MNNRMDTFAQLERLSAQIDVWIDEEDYGNVIESIQVTNDEDDDLEARVEACFRHPYCTDGKGDDWRDILHGVPSVPATSVRPEDPPHDWIDLSDREGWSQLFYAKLLRARIMQRGTDCYLLHLDEVIAYLERHVPTPVGEETAKLAILSLLELSAAAAPFEIIGFAERAERMMREHPKMFGDDRETWQWFYNLLAKYNMGIGHFHLGRYRRAILEFNSIIWQVQEAKKAARDGTMPRKVHLSFFRHRHGYDVLYLPAVRYRADIQLKLQFAYHALDTLKKYFNSEERISAYKNVSATMVKAEAYRQMGRVGDAESWERLTDAYEQLATFEESADQLGKRGTLQKLPGRMFKGPYLNAKGRFLDIFVEDHLEWFKQSSPEGDQPQRIRCSEILQEILLSDYFNAIKYNALSRNGYYQQLAKLIAWLTRAEDGNEKLRTTAMKLFEDRMRQFIDEPDVDTCVHCNWQGIDLAGIDQVHYSWITEDLLGFYKSMADWYSRVGSQKRANQRLEKAKEKLVDRLVKEEREKRLDLRVNDLELRYKLRGIKDKLEGGLELCRAYNRSARRGKEQAFNGLLDGTGSGARADADANTRSMTSRRYLQVMRAWDESNRRRLESASNHEEHKQGLYLCGLQRWNSSSPAQGRSVGGGYLLYQTDDKGTVNLGIAIDPGFDFVRNLFHMGFSIRDIDIVVISHSHVDHVRDFESIVQLLTDLKKESQDNREKCVHVILSLGVYERLKHIIEDPFFRYHVEPYIIDAHREIEREYFENISSEDAFRFIEWKSEEQGQSASIMHYRAVLPEPDDASGIKTSCPQPRVTIQPTRAYHTDPSHYSDSFGFLITVAGLSEPSDNSAESSVGGSVTLGYTGDTKWVYPKVPDPLPKVGHAARVIKDITPQYANCNAVIVHLGSLVKRNDKGFRVDLMNCRTCDKNQQVECRDLVCEKDHPYLAGMLRMLSRLHSEVKKDNRTQLVLVSEFGEELRGGIRIDLIQRLTRAYGDVLYFLPMDVGMDIQLWHKTGAGDNGGRDRSPAQKVWCVQCERFVEIGDAEFERYGVDEALFCVCRTCRKATPLNVLQDRLRQLYEIGRELRSADGG